MGAKGGVGGTRPSIPPRIVPDNTVLTLQRCELGIPHPAVEIPTVEKNDGASGTSYFVEKRAARHTQTPRIGRCGSYARALVFRYTRDQQQDEKQNARVRLTGGLSVNSIS